MLTRLLIGQLRNVVEANSKYTSSIDAKTVELAGKIQESENIESIVEQSNSQLMTIEEKMNEFSNKIEKMQNAIYSTSSSQTLQCKVEYLEKLMATCYKEFQEMNQKSKQNIEEISTAFTYRINSLKETVSTLSQINTVNLDFEGTKQKVYLI
jgi:archaellum component FlaC